MSGQHVSPSEFARKAGVSRQAIHKAIGAGEVVRGQKGIDLHDGTNKAYLVRALARAAGHPEKSRKPPVAVAAPKKQPAAKPKSKKGAKKQAAAKPEPIPKEDDKSKADRVRELLESAGLGEAGFDVSEMVAVVMQRGYWETVKIKEDVLKRQLDRAREVGSVVDTRILETEIGTYHQALVANFVDAPQRQAIQICQVCGIEGKEKIVMELLEGDNAKRLAESDRAVKDMAKKLAARMRRKKVASA